MKNVVKKMTEKAIEAPDLSILREEHVNKWVALSTNYKKILAVGESLFDVVKKSTDTKEKVIMQVLPSLGYVPNFVR